MIHDRREPALADAVANLLAVRPSKRLHVDLEIHVGAVLPVEVVPRRVEDPELLVGRVPGAPVRRSAPATPRPCVCRSWCAGEGLRLPVGLATSLRGRCQESVGTLDWAETRREERTREQNPHNGGLGTPAREGADAGEMGDFMSSEYT